MEQRRLAAIVVSDISGYTALMGENERKALSLLKRNRRLHRSVIKKHNGKIIVEAGDGTFACFNSTLDAMISAVVLMKKATEKPGYSLHIGIHLAEVVVSGKKIQGEGIKLASMIQSSANQGEILISEVVYRNIRNYEGVKAEFLGMKTFLKATEEIGIYRLSPEGIKLNNASKTSDSEGINTPGIIFKTLIKNKSAWTVRILIILGITLFIILKNQNFFIARHSDNLKKSIAILPFRNEGNEQETQYFSNGVMESILNNLARISALRVTSRTSTEGYRDTTLPARSIGRQLEVNYLLEGSVQKYGQKVRIAVQLINAKEDKHVWSETYDRL